MKKFYERLKYKFDQFLSLGTIALVLSLFLAMFLIVSLIGVIIYIINPNLGLGNLIWVSFMQTLDPGNLSGEQGSFVYMIMMTLATIVGIFLTSLFISFILNGFQNRLEKLSRGRSKVIEKNHTLILGWDDNIYVILNELIEANKSIKKPVIVILSDIDSVEMNQKLRDNISKKFNTKIICRTGSIYKNEDLDMCNIVDAKSIIINENDMNTIKSLLVVVNSDFYTKSEGHICALMYDECNIQVAKNIGKEKLEVVCLSSAITRIITQTCLQPGLSYIYNELLEFRGDEIYFYHNEEVIGRTFAEVVLMFNNAVVIGVKSNGKIHINPKNDFVINKTDDLILICEDEDTATINTEQPTINIKAIHSAKRKTSIKKANIFVIGFNPKTVSVIKEFNNYLANGSRIKILVNSETYINELENLDAELDKLNIEICVGDTFSRDVLEKYVPQDNENIIIFANENVCFKDRDSQTLLTLLHLRDMEEEYSVKYDIITEIADVKNSEIIDLAKVDDFIISELMANKMLAQISENRYLQGIFNHLLSDEGSEIYLKPISDYVDIKEPLDFYTLVQAATLKGEVAIGYKLIREKGLPIIKLNPNKSDNVTYNDLDSLIVISED